jgi:hypothetical protein
MTYGAELHLTTPRLTPVAPVTARTRLRLGRSDDIARKHDAIPIVRREVLRL